MEKRRSEFFGGASFTLEFTGAEADEHYIDMYDVSQALISFQRSLALTTHLVINDEIITQAPSLKGARIYSLPPEPGSWKTTAVVAAIGAGIYQIGTLQNNSPLGHLVFSLYDYVVSESLGVHVDYNKSLGQLYKEAEKNKIKLPEIRESQADSLIEKCSTAIRELHRPIYKSESATLGRITGNISGRSLPIRTELNLETYEYIHETRVADQSEVIEGRITSYNANTYKGRIYVPQFGRPVSFELALDARSSRTADIITTSLRHTALKEFLERGSTVYAIALRNTSKTGRLKTLTFLRVSDKSFN